jgi:glutathione peroxidase
MRFTITLLSFLELLGFPILMKGQSLRSIYQFSATSIEGTEIQFASFKGKKILIVNTASQCGLTPQFKALQELYDAYKDKGLLIIGFPSNDFAKQDPGTNAEIKSFFSRIMALVF